MKTGVWLIAFMACSVTFAVEQNLETARDAVFTEVKRDYPNMANPESKQWKVADQMARAAFDPKSPDHLAGQSVNAPRYFADKAARYLCMAVVRHGAVVEPAPTPSFSKTPVPWATPQPAPVPVAPPPPPAPAPTQSMLLQDYEGAPVLIRAVREDNQVRSNEPGWTMHAGEVYQFVRFMTQSAYLGGSLPTHDRSFVVARVGDVSIATSVREFLVVSPDEMSQAQATYDKEVKDLDAYYDKIAKQMAARDGVTQQQALDQLQRIRQMNNLRFLKGP